MPYGLKTFIKTEDYAQNMADILFEPHLKQFGVLISIDIVVSARRLFIETTISSLDNKMLNSLSF